MMMKLSYSMNHFLDSIQKDSKNVGREDLMVQRILVSLSSIHFHFGEMKVRFVKTIEGKIVHGMENSNLREMEDSWKNSDENLEPLMSKNQSCSCWNKVVHSIDMKGVIFYLQN